MSVPGSRFPRLRRAARAVRDAWLAVGITLIGFLLLEAAYRGQAAARGAAGGGDGGDETEPALDLPHPNSRHDWWRDYHVRPGPMERRFDPYRMFWQLEYHSRYINIDAAGRRVTPQPPAPPSARRILMLGGSTMWGVTVRDSFTVAAALARRLPEAGTPPLTVENQGQASFRTTQEAATLMVELARGDPPAAVVVLDGYNDASLALRLRQVGQVNGEDALQRRLDLGSRGFWGELVGLGRHSRLIARLQRTVSRPPQDTRAPFPGDICAATAAYYQRVARAMTGIGARFGVPVWFFLQPMHFLSAKPPTPWEQALRQRTRDPGELRRCMLAIDSLMRAQTEVRYASLHRIFDADTATVFVDEHGHVTEAANDRMAACIAALVLPEVAGAGAAPARPPECPSASGRAPSEAPPPPGPAP